MPMDIISYHFSVMNVCRFAAKVRQNRRLWAPLAATGLITRFPEKTGTDHHHPPQKKSGLPARTFLPTEITCHQQACP
jgi:hypothetical protein